MLAARRAGAGAVAPTASANRGTACSTSGRGLPVPPRLAAGRAAWRQQPWHQQQQQQRQQPSAARRVLLQAPNSQRQAEHGATGAPEPDALADRLTWQLLLLAAAGAPLAHPAAAAAEEGLKYNAERGEGLVKSLSGAAYVALLLYFLVRVLNRRARKAREERIAGQGPITTIFTNIIEKATEGKTRVKATPLNTFIGAAQAGLIAYGLFIFTAKVEDLVTHQALPTGYTAERIAITVRTIIVGLLYLVTFIFSANTLGLAGLSVQLLIWPDLVPDEPPPPSSRATDAAALPKVTVTSSRDEIRRAFEVAAKVPGGASKSSTSGGSSSSSSSSGAGAVEPSPAGTATSSRDGA